MKQLIGVNYFLLYFCFVLSFSNFSVAQTNTGTDFWLGFMEHVDVNANTKVLMIASENGANGIVSMPKQSFTQNFSVGSNNVVFVTLPLTAEPIGSESVFTTGVHVTADDSIVVYAHQYANSRSEASLILPNESLGTEYYIMSMTGFQSGIIYPSEFLIVATEDNTLVTWIPSDLTKLGKTAGSINAVTLDKGETFQVQALSATGDLTSSAIIATKPVAVFGGNKWTKVGGCGLQDNLYEEMYPVNTWGREFITTVFRGRTSDIFRIMASEDNTTVFVDGVAQIPTLNAGEYIERQLSQASYIKATNPLMIAQYMVGVSCSGGNGIGDPSVVLINPIEQTIKKSTFFASPFESIDSNYVNIVIRTSDTSKVILDGTSVGGLFQEVIGNNLFSFARITIDTGVHILEAIGSCGFIGIVYGEANPESYAYSLGASFKSVANITVGNQSNSLALPNSGCVGDSLQFSATSTDSILFLIWDFGDSTMDSIGTPLHAYTDTGAFNVNLTVAIFSACNGSDTITASSIITIGRIDTVNFPLDNVCNGTTINFIDSSKVSNDSIYRWYWNFGDNIIDSSGANTMHLYSDSGTYQVSLIVGTQYGCFDTSIVKTLQVYPLPAFEAGTNSTICDIGTYQFGDTSISYYSYNWQPSLGLNDNTISNPTTAANSTTVYTVTVTDTTNTCFITDSLTVFVKTTPTPLLQDTFIFIGNCAILDANIDTGTFSWTPNTYLDSINIAHPTSCPDDDITYQLAISQNGCTANSQIFIDVIHDYLIEIPKAFTPNDDGENDFLVPITRAIKEVVSFSIFDRWGKQVYLGEGNSAAWNGTYNGKPLPAGMYVWKINAIDFNNLSVEVIGQSALIR